MTTSQLNEEPQPLPPRKSIDEQGPVSLHPDFNQGDVILQSADGVGFCYDIATLGKYSPVFRDLSTLPHSERSSCRIPILDASSKAIAFVLHVVQHSQEECPDAHGADRASLTELEDVLEEVLEMIDTFDMDSLTELILEWGRQVDAPPGVMYCLVCLTGVGDKQYWATRCLSVSEAEQRGPAFKLLKRYSPEDAVALGRAGIKWRAAVDEFERVFMADEEISHFGGKCAEQPCPVYQTFDGDSGQLKWHILRELVPVVLAAPLEPEEARLDLMLVCNNDLACRKCARRMSSLALHTWKLTMAPPPWILHSTHPSLVSEIKARRRT